MLLALPRTPVTNLSSALRPLVILLTVVGVGAVTWWGATGLAEWTSGFAKAPDGTTIVAGDEVEVEIPPGSSARAIAEILEGAGVVQADEFQRAVQRRRAASELRPGTYTFVTGTSADLLVDAIRLGPPIRTFWLTIPEGLRVGEVLDRLDIDTPRDREDFETALLDGSVSSVLIPDGEVTLHSWEGLLFPDTYEFSEAATAAEILRRLSATMEQRVASVDWSGLEESGLTVYEGLVIASLVESEAAVDGDRPLISSVITNRMAISMPLQIDATVLYALDRRGGSVTLVDLEVDSPWNTYRVLGLPPTPIGAPGLASLRAAADPEETDYLFYVLTSTEGSHSFTDNYDEFLAFKAKAKADGVIP